MRRDLTIGTWHESHFGIVIARNDWGVQIYDDKSPWHSGISEQMWAHCEWFPFASKNQKVELL